MRTEHSNFAGKQIGLTCSYIPEEFILAAGMEPVWIRGLVDEIHKSHSYTCSNTCPYVESLLDSGLAHRFGRLSGIIFADSCDCMRRLNDLWAHYVKTPFTYLLEIPKNQNKSGVTYFADRLLDLKKNLEAAFGLTITEHNLRQAVSLMNDRRRMTNDIMEGQKEIPPRHSGSELFSAFMSDPARDESCTDTVLKDLAAGPADVLPPVREKPRLMVIGNRIDRSSLFEMVENAGGLIVVPDSCNGLKRYSFPVDSSLPPVEAIARAYLNGPSCARMPGFEGRLERIGRLIHDYKIHGIIYNRLKNCDYSLFETPQLENFVQNIGIPLLVLETDYIWHDTGRIRTRVEAFMEMLEKKT